ncbi:MAG: hypothetical protein KJ727_07625 [Acidobacteria bacterium]|nr:hypothetical protein [Verrucomicrobiota bacterium]MBU4254451.1 hypothetical protein [Acidobacteriota bacterium]MBU4330167.1 hypothetical protein [Acidobacteriota bacterium]MBU4495235.1 hypothetical protein [Acidobacteriota bacterium]MCG2814502.1 hypothetical protein [Candidatus Aminicenantes bacterium]
MKCKHAEKLILRSFDFRLSKVDQECLDRHQDSCGDCRRIKDEYDVILGTLHSTRFPEPKPYFTERFRARLKDTPAFDPFAAGKAWILKTASVIAFSAVVLSAGMIFLSPDPAVLSQENMSDSEILLLKNLNPFQETRTVFEAGSVENKNMMLIFSALGDKNGLRKYFP